MESLVIGLLFARHASQEGRHIFPSYSQWFSALFAAESTSPVTDKQSFVFFVRDCGVRLFFNTLLPFWKSVYVIVNLLCYVIFLYRYICLL